MGQFNIGGGLLAAAGAIGGVGQGITQVAQEQQKTNYATKMNDLAQAREEAITRLQQSGQQQLEGQREGFQAAQTDKEIGGRAAVATMQIAHREAEAEKERGFSKEMQGEKLKSEERRTGITAGSRVEVQRLKNQGMKEAASSKGVSKPVFKPIKVQLSAGLDAEGHPIPGKQISAIEHEDGSQWVGIQGNGKDGQPLGALVPLNNAAEDGIGIKPGDLARAPATAVQALLKNPLGMAPSGMTMRDSFYNRFHYLPNEYLGSANAVRMQQAQQSQQGSGGMGSQSDDAEDSESQTQADSTSSVPDYQPKPAGIGED